MLKEQMVGQRRREEVERRREELKHLDVKRIQSIVRGNIILPPYYLLTPTWCGDSIKLNHHTA
jgi:hypothetical protein